MSVDVRLCSTSLTVICFLLLSCATGAKNSSSKGQSYDGDERESVADDRLADLASEAENTDHSGAMRELTLLAEQGDIDAQYNLGRMYYRGEVLTRDYVNAYMWWLVAASRGHTKADLNRKKLEYIMAPVQISTARELARLCPENSYKNCGRKNIFTEMSPIKISSDVKRREDAETINTDINAGSADQRRQVRPSAATRAYILAIQKRIMGNWSRTAENAKMPVCQVGVKQSPEGMILGVKFIKCSGTDAAYRASIQNAIYMAEPLPKPKDPTIFDPDLRLIFTSWE